MCVGSAALLLVSLQCFWSGCLFLLVFDRWRPADYPLFSWMFQPVFSLPHPALPSFSLPLSLCCRLGLEASFPLLICISVNSPGALPFRQWALTMRAYVWIFSGQIALLQWIPSVFPSWTACGQVLNLIRKRSPSLVFKGLLCVFLNISESMIIF